MASTFKFNKWLFLAGTGIATALSCGVYALTSHSNQDQLNLTNNLLNGLDTMGELKQVLEEPKVSEDKPEETITQEIPTSEATKPTKGEKPVVQSDDSANVKGQSNTGTNNQNAQDQNYLKQIGKHSMGWKYKDSMVLAPKDNAIWKERQQRMISNYSKGGKVYTWWKGFISEETIKKNETGYWAYDFCTTALSYSEWTTFWRRGISKRYLDFVWNICAKDGVAKPKGWWW